MTILVDNKSNYYYGKASYCSSRLTVAYKGKVHHLRLWLIGAGSGQPVLSFEDYSAQQRYPSIGVSEIFEPPYVSPAVLPEGESTVYQYLEDNWQKVRKSRARKKMLRKLVPYLVRESSPYKASKREQESWGFSGIYHEFDRFYLSNVHWSEAREGFSGHFPKPEEEEDWEVKLLSKYKKLKYFARLAGFVSSQPFLVHYEDMSREAWKTYLRLLFEFKELK